MPKDNVLDRSLDNLGGIHLLPHDIAFIFESINTYISHEFLKFHFSPKTYFSPNSEEEDSRIHNSFSTPLNRKYILKL